MRASMRAFGNLLYYILQSPPVLFYFKKAGYVSVLVLYIIENTAAVSYNNIGKRFQA